MPDIVELDKLLEECVDETEKGQENAFGKIRLNKAKKRKIKK
jgi:hypothetical protein